ncbi:MAG: calcium-binding protein [Bradyrhizobium sp.]|uniref:calcium-binding protein n=1 Tax=Bradyrhizobium sp. TaxID=376 RepID=UPI002717A6AD|nr:calcium-binding protein [Bradyrhizobium sp.]MDO8401470.1 calcium-binding protein [Bradyrhizobium sp.]
MATVTFTNNNNPNPGLEDVLVRNGAVTAAASTFEITNNTGGPLDGFSFSFFSAASNFTYNGTTPTGGTVTSVTVYDDQMNVIATISGIPDRSLLGFWSALQGGTAISALTHLLGSQSNKYVGSNGDDHLTSFCAIADDRLDGGAGNDVLIGGRGSDWLVGGQGDDTYIFAANEFDGDDIIHGSGLDTARFTGSNTITSGDSFEVERVQFAGALSLTFDFGFNRDFFDFTVIGDGHVNRIKISVVDGTQFTLEDLGFQSWSATADTVTINGSSSNDDITGSNVGDVISGFAGRDMLFGRAGNDVLKGGAGVDFLDGGSGNDILLGEAGIDILDGGSGNDTLDGGTEADTIDGGSGNDILKGRAGADHLDGGIGNDTLFGEAGIDILDGGSGNDTLDGGTEADTIDGGSGNDILKGGAGADNLDGGSGNDTLAGGAGYDILTGGSGRDNFLFNTSLRYSRDQITDFSVADDTIRLDNAVFTKLGGGVLAANAFVIGEEAQDAADRIIYNKATGDLFYDTDGTGSVAAVKFAELDAGLALTRWDFFVV